MFRGRRVHQPYTANLLLLIAMPGSSIALSTSLIPNLLQKELGRHEGTKQSDDLESKETFEVDL